MGHAAAIAYRCGCEAAVPPPRIGHRERGSIHLALFVARTAPRRTHYIIAREQRLVTSRSYLRHWPPGHRLFSSQTNSKSPSFSHCGLSFISISSVQGRVKIFGSSTVNSYEIVSLSI